MPSYNWGLSNPAPETPSSMVETTVVRPRVGSATDYGLDITTWAIAGEPADLDPAFRLIDGKRSVGEAVARRLCMDRTTLEDDQNAGFNVLRLLNSKWTAPHQFRLQSQIIAEAKKDPRVLDASTKITHHPKTRSLLVEIVLSTTAGKVELVLTADQLGVSVLRGIE